MPKSTYEPLASVTITSSIAQINLSNIPQNYTDLVLVITAKVSAGADIWIRANGDSSTSYSYTELDTNGSTVSSSRAANQSNGFLTDWYGTPTTNNSHSCICNFNNYSNTTMFKSMLSRANRASSGLDAVVSLWRKTNAIKSLTLRFSGGSTFDAGTVVSLYGIGANQLKATGGDIITTDGTYWYHTFTSSGTFTPQTSITCDYLVVAGGGGGGGNNAGSGGSGAGGGGGGGLRSTVTATGGGGLLESTLSLSANTSYAVTIGSGGAGGISNLTTAGTTGTNGSSTTFSTITATGGGGGGGQDLVGANGGSGGGGGSNNKSGGSGTTNQGYAGGSSGNGSTAYRGGGGGGAGAAGTSGVSSAPTGGNGVSISQLAIITGTGVSNNYAGGGGGGSYNGLPGAGGAGGGGAGAQQDDGGFGVPNTGGGGGGAGYNGYSFGGNGGSGLVIVRYAV